MPSLLVAVTIGPLRQEIVLTLKQAPVVADANTENHGHSLAPLSAVVRICIRPGAGDEIAALAVLHQEISSLVEGVHRVRELVRKVHEDLGKAPDGATPGILNSSAIRYVIFGVRAARSAAGRSAEDARHLHRRPVLHQDELCAAGFQHRDQRPAIKGDLAVARVIHFV
eukprot:6439432-Prymnesium_polylepis.2